MKQELAPSKLSACNGQPAVPGPGPDHNPALDLPSLKPTILIGRDRLRMEENTAQDLNALVDVLRRWDNGTGSRQERGRGRAVRDVMTEQLPTCLSYVFPGILCNVDRCLDRPRCWGVLAWGLWRDLHSSIGTGIGNPQG